MEYKDMKFWDAVKNLPTRLINMVAKLLGMKGVVLAGTVCLFEEELLPEEVRGYVWIFIVLIVVFGKEALNFFKDIKK